MTPNLFPVHAAAPAPSPKPTFVTSADLLAVTRRLALCAGDYLATAPRVGLHPTPAHLLRVVEAVLAEATNRPVPPWADTVEGFFLRGLFDELAQQPSNLYTGTQTIHGEEVPVPVDRAAWIECLQVFRAAILRGDIVVPSPQPVARRSTLIPAASGHVFVPTPDDSDTPRTSPAELAAIKTWTREILGLVEDDVITVSELNCRDPGCPLVETVVVVFAERVTMRWQFARPGCAVTKAMLQRTLTAPPV